MSDAAPDWAVLKAQELILLISRWDTGDAPLTALVAAHLRIIREEGAGDGIDRLGAALGVEVHVP